MIGCAKTNSTSIWKFLNSEMSKEAGKGVRILLFSLKKLPVWWNRQFLYSFFNDFSFNIITGYKTHRFHFCLIFFIYSFCLRYYVDTGRKRMDARILLLIPSFHSNIWRESGLTMINNKLEYKKFWLQNFVVF